jgi:hypothetical protein
MDKGFINLTKLVIDKLEGGYYHPDMLKDGRVKDSRYSSSGETLYGIDRKHGGEINTSSAGKRFWSIIDNAGARKKWKWNYFPSGQMKEELQSLVAEMIYPLYKKLSDRYLSDRAQELVNKDDRLKFNFIYATWNGSGWFKSFASKLNRAIEGGVSDTDKLTKVVLDARINNQAKSDSARSLIRQGGNKIASFIDTLKSSAEEVYEKEAAKYGKSTVNIGIGIIFLTVTLVGGGLAFYYIKNKK